MARDAVSEALEDVDAMLGRAGGRGRKAAAVAGGPAAPGSRPAAHGPGRAQEQTRTPWEEAAAAQDEIQAARDEIRAAQDEARAARDEARAAQDEAAGSPGGERPWTPDAGSRAGAARSRNPADGLYGRASQLEERIVRLQDRIGRRLAQLFPEPPAPPEPPTPPMPPRPPQAP